jgi:hypothetical protein
MQPFVVVFEFISNDRIIIVAFFVAGWGAQEEVGLCDEEE